MSRRLLVSFLLVAATVLTALEIPLGIQNARTADHDLEAQIVRDVVAVAALAEDSLEQGTALPPTVGRVATRYRDRTGGRVVIVDEQGIAVLDTDVPKPPAAGRNFLTRPEIKAALAGRIAAGTRTSETLGHRLLYVAAPAASTAPSASPTRRQPSTRVSAATGLCSPRSPGSCSAWSQAAASCWRAGCRGRWRRSSGPPPAQVVATSAHARPTTPARRRCARWRAASTR